MKRSKQMSFSFQFYFLGHKVHVLGYHAYIISIHKKPSSFKWVPSRSQVENLIRLATQCVQTLLFIDPLQWLLSSLMRPRVEITISRTSVVHFPPSNSQKRAMHYWVRVLTVYLVFYCLKAAALWTVVCCWTELAAQYRLVWI